MYPAQATIYALPFSQICLALCPMCLPRNFPQMNPAFVPHQPFHCPHTFPAIVVICALPSPLCGLPLYPHLLYPCPHMDFAWCLPSFNTYAPPCLLPPYICHALNNRIFPFSYISPALVPNASCRCLHFPALAFICALPLSHTYSVISSTSLLLP